MPNENTNFIQSEFMPYILPMLYQGGELYDPTEWLSEYGDYLTPKDPALFDISERQEAIERRKSGEELNYNVSIKGNSLMFDYPHGTPSLMEKEKKISKSFS